MFWLLGSDTLQAAVVVSNVIKRQCVHFHADTDLKHLTHTQADDFRKEKHSHTHEHTLSRKHTKLNANTDSEEI